MRLILFALLSSVSFIRSEDVSPKRGLAYGSWSGGADEIWNAQKSPLTWYYNFKTTPSKGIVEGKMEFVPMMYDASKNNSGFYEKVKGMIDKGANINYVLGFNEPDICYGGGSCVDALTAAKTWKKEIEPLKNHGVKLGAPAVTGGDTTWLRDFYTACDGGCSTDFIPLHYYATTDGLIEWVKLIRSKYPNATLWVTEFACPDCPLDISQDTFNTSVAFLDKEEYIERYSYFGAFRSSKSNTFLGPSGTMLDPTGGLTDIGVWYLGLPMSDVGKTKIGPEFVASKSSGSDGSSDSNGSNNGIASIAMLSWWQVLAITAMCCIFIVFR